MIENILFSPLYSIPLLSIRFHSSTHLPRFSSRGTFFFAMGFRPDYRTEPTTNSRQVGMIILQTNRYDEMPGLWQPSATIAGRSEEMALKNHYCNTSRRIGTSILSYHLPILCYCRFLAYILALPVVSQSTRDVHLIIRT